MRDNDFTEKECNDRLRVRGQINIFRYRKVGKFTIRVDSDDRFSDILLRVFAVVIAENELTVSLPIEMKESNIAEFLKSSFCRYFWDCLRLKFETDSELSQRISEGEISRLAYAGKDKVPASIFSIAAQNGLTVLWNSPLTEGRIMMLEQFYEQSLCHTYHRYGNLGLRGVEAKLNDCNLKE
jgi:RHH-type proline utilization regulon transcriptional repressor/proline dehydrogenase/delta 1-pyrroline-5-carboxylate dehydrogenase